MDDFDWDHLAKQFRQDDVLMSVVDKIGKAQGTYFNALTAEGLSGMQAMKIVSITVTEVGKFARETLPVLMQLFIDYNERNK